MRTGARYPKLNIRTLERNGLKWVNIENPSDADLKWLEENYGFHPMALYEGPSYGQMSTINDYDTYLFLVLHFPVFDHEARITLAARVDIFVGGNYVITLHDGALKPLVRLFQRCEADEQSCSDIIRQSSGYLLYNVLDVLIDHCFAILNKIEENVDRVELLVFDERIPDLVKEISIVRRDIIAYRRIMRHQIGVMEELESGDYPFLMVESEVYFGGLADNIHSIASELDELREVIEGLGDAHSTIINHQTNRIIRILTIMSAILLPLSVISGLYGMNVSLPLSGTPYAFGVVLGVMGAVAGGMLVFFRTRHWL